MSPPSKREEACATACSFPPPLLPTKTSEPYARKEYWDGRFAREEHYEWLESPETALRLVLPFLQPSSLLLMVGCGNSQLSESLYACGIRRSVNLDFSYTTLHNKSRKERRNISRYLSPSSSSCDESDASLSVPAGDAGAPVSPSGVCTPGVRHLRDEGFLMEYLCMDMRRLPAFLRRETFDVVIDKAGMDALTVEEGSVWSPAMRVRENVRSYLQGVSSALRPGGIFVQITFQQPHFRRRYFLDDFSSPPFSSPSPSSSKKKARLVFSRKEDGGEDKKKKNSGGQESKKDETREDKSNLSEEEEEWVLPESFPYREEDIFSSSSSELYWADAYGWSFFSCEIKKKEAGCFNNFLFVARKSLKRPKSQQ